MHVTIPDEVVRETGLTEREVLLELACRLFDIEKLALWPAARLAGLSRVQMEGELRKRSISIYRITEEEFQHDLRTMEYMESLRKQRGPGSQ